MLQCSRTERVQCGRGPLNCFCPYHKTTVLNKTPSITFLFLSPTNYMIQKILKSCFEIYLLQQLSLSIFQPKSIPKSYEHRHQVEGTGSQGTPVEKLCQEGKGALQMIQQPAPFQPATTSLLATSQPWEKPSEKHHIHLVRPKGKAAGPEKHWPELLKLPTRWYSALKKFSAFFNTHLCPEPYLTLIHLITSITKLHCSRM